MFKRLSVSLATLLVSAVIVTPASASYLSPDGLVFSFFNDGLTAPDLVADGSDTYAIRVVLDYSGYTGNSTDYINAVSIGVGAYDQGTLFSETAPNSWTYVPNGLNAGGCSGGSAVQMCADSNDGTAFLTGGTGTYTWVFHVDTTSGLDDTIHFKANWYSTGGGKDGADVKVGGNISLDFQYDEGETEHTTEVRTTGDVPVPEPGSLLLLGSGLVGAASRFRRRNR